MNQALKSVIDWEGVCKAKGKDPKALPNVESFPEAIQKYILNHWMLIEVIDFFNEGKRPNYTDGSRKWYPWPYVDADKERPAGFGLSAADCRYVFSSTRVGSRLCFRDEETAIHVFENFKDMYVMNQLFID